MSFVETNHVDDMKNKTGLRKKKAYVSWEDNASILTSVSSSSEEEAKLYLPTDQISKVESVNGYNFTKH